MKFKNYKKLTDEFATKILYPVKCVNKNCPFYKDNLKKADQGVPNSKSDYKLHCIYREFNVDFFKMPLEELPKNASSLRFRKYDANIMGLCLTLHVNLGLSLRKTSQALMDLYGFKVSHQQIANYSLKCIPPPFWWGYYRTIPDKSINIISKFLTHRSVSDIH